MAVKKDQLSQRDELEMLMLEKERRRRKSASEAEENIAGKKQVVGETLADIATVAPQGPTFGFADEIAGGVAAAYKKASGDERPIEELYEETRDLIRDKTKAARERSPLSTFITEGAGAALVSGGSGGILKTMGQSAAMGLGESEEEDVEGMLIDSTISAGLGGISHGVTELVKMPFKKRAITRSKNLGATADDFKKVGSALGDPEVMAQDLTELQFFKHPSSMLNTDTLKFEPRHKTGALSLPSRENSLRSAKSGLKRLTSAKKKIFNRVGDKVDRERLLGRIAEDLQGMQEKSIDRGEFNKIAKEEVSKLINDIGDRGTLTRLEVIKQNWQNQAQKSFESSASDPVFKDRSEIQKRISTSIKETVEDMVTEATDARTGEHFMQMNALGQHLHQAKKGLVSRIAGEKAVGSEMAKAVNPYASAALQAAKIGEVMGGGEKGQLARAATGDFMADLIPQGIERQIKMSPSRFMSRKDEVEREPQSIPEELVRYKIPRSSEEVLENSDQIKLKIAQQAPELFDDVQEIFDNQPEKVGDLLPLIQSIAPHLLEDDKYGRIDGVIIDPVKKQMAREDLNLNEDLSNSQRMLMMNQLNKTGEFEL